MDLFNKKNLIIGVLYVNFGAGEQQVTNYVSFLKLLYIIYYLSTTEIWKILLIYSIIIII